MSIELSAALSEVIRSKRRRWLVTGAAGFIGSHLLEVLLGNGQEVVALDDLSTGTRENIDEAERLGLASDVPGTLRFVEGDVADAATCRDVMQGVDHVLHQAAIASVPAAQHDPERCHAVNVTGFINLLEAARHAGARRFVYATSSAVYGDETSSPNREDRLGTPLSVYGASKRADELYAAAYSATYGAAADGGLKPTGLRYFNIFGPRQRPMPGGAVIPRWIEDMASGQPIIIYGDGRTTRDFCFIADVVEANLLAATCGEAGQGEIFNIAMGRETSLFELAGAIAHELGERGVAGGGPPRHGEFRVGDVRNSHADIGKAQSILGYAPRVSLQEGLRETVGWYLNWRSTRV